MRKPIFLLIVSLISCGFLYTASLEIENAASGRAHLAEQNRERADLGDLTEASAEVFSIFGELVVTGLYNTWQVAPEGIQCIFGFLLMGLFTLVILGIVALWSGISLWTRFLG